MQPTSQVAGQPTLDVESLWRRAGVGVQPDTLERLAEGDAFAALGLQRLDALWTTKALRASALLHLFGPDGDGGVPRPTLRRAVDQALAAAGAGTVGDHSPLRLHEAISPSGNLRPEIELPCYEEILQLIGSQVAPRANWKGTLKIAEVICSVALYTAASTSDRIAFHTINRATGNRVRREFVDGDTGDVVAREDQVKGYEIADGDNVILQPDEIAAAIPDSDKVLNVVAFANCEDIDDVYFDKPYYLAPTGRPSVEAFALIRDGLVKTRTVAIAQAVLFRRMRNVLIRPHGAGLVATTLNFDYEVRSADAAFKDIADTKLEREMLDLARHIINTKMGDFDISSFDDRYENALADLVKAKLEGRKITLPAKPKDDGVVDLMAALRESAATTGKTKPAKRKADKAEPAAPKRKAS